MASTVTDRLAILASAVSDIAVAIGEMGGEAPSRLSQYGEAIRALPVGTTESPVRYKATIKTWPECIRTFTAPAHCEQIGSSAFRSAATLASVDLANVLDITGETAFAACPNLTTVDGVALKSMTGRSAFASCSKLASVSLPVCTDIGQYAFYQCGSYEYRSPDYVYSGLSSVSFPLCRNIGSSAFQRCYNLQRVSFPAAVTVHPYAFADCSTLASVSMSKAVTVGSSAFQKCVVMSSVSFPVCEVIGSWAFASCSKLASASFPNCTEVGSYAFVYCSELSKVAIPSCQTLWSYAFASCSKLALVDFTGATAVPVLKSSNAFNNSSLVKCKVPASLYAAWIAAEVWSTVASRVSTVG